MFKEKHRSKTEMSTPAKHLTSCSVHMNTLGTVPGPVQGTIEASMIRIGFSGI